MAEKAGSAAGIGVARSGLWWKAWGAGRQTTPTGDAQRGSVQGSGIQTGKEELVVQVFGKQEGTFMRAGQAEAEQLPALGVEVLAGKRTKILEAAFWALAA